MNRIDAIFARLRTEGRKGLMPFLTAGDPDLAATADLLAAIQRAGACICELGIPFSDPIADGPVIQASMTHALRGGIHHTDIFEMARRLRPTLTIGLVAMVSYSIVYRCGHSGGGGDGDEWAFIKAAKEAGFDGFIVPDIPIDEAQPLVEATAAHGLTCSFLISPTTPDDRAAKIARACTGFVYVLSRAGLTGEQAALPPELPDRLRRLRDVTDLPLAVGFGVSDRRQVESVTQVADAAIVGSAIMRRIADLRDAPRQRLLGRVESFVRELSGSAVDSSAAT